ncbi:MAG: CheR family methyltransferase [Casimicrobiaceae bacterium]
MPAARRIGGSAVGASAMARLGQGDVADVADEVREFVFTSRDLERVRVLIYERAGIALNPHKQTMVYGRLARRLRACGTATFGAYLDRLEKNPTLPEWEAFINALTTNLTAFFRESHHFPVLRAHLLAKRLRRAAVIWCAAASTGEEAYSIAITACEAFGTLAPPVRIIASDIDTEVLAVGDQGVYAIERSAGMSTGLLRRYFLKGDGVNAGLIRVRPEVRSLIEFRHINLREDCPDVETDLHAIFCRNVLIYFDRGTQLAVLTRLAPLLGADGLLFTGHSESLAYATPLFRPLGNTVYTRGSPPTNPRAADA